MQRTICVLIVSSNCFLLWFNYVLNDIFLQMRTQRSKMHLKMTNKIKRKLTEHLQKKTVSQIFQKLSISLEKTLIL